MNEKELLVPVAVEELAALEAMAMLSNCEVIDFRTLSSKIDERAEKVGDDSKSLIGLMSLAYVIFEYKKRGREEAAQKIFDELKPEITPSVVELLDVLEEEWRENNK
ncbi:hypothetical protein GKD00_05125 [Lactobacillus ruminis]|uniref:hypothetical protein n=1 Tax=Ligilactobacillus ruminis TaxID=1623 RepID=UPI00101EA0C4|nr:hypothetical protein [Ligilactobacillus ruminis]MSB43615.1 hypothetical protein [Ligilactobacillus ruminis]MSB54612.1 hypothetical protein [Ligilactobacillus ruminis]MSB56303.1 hypothetical protein [Ligilactobacillus ruminis]MSB81351.1 hypothetical protein [Ligilactobacillus ruminis]MSB91147.1 hypothetical protein [Ligilactobacillus ruminis]